MTPKISKQVRAKIQHAIAALDTGIAFIDQPKTHVVRETSLAGMPDDVWYSGRERRGIAINKEIGSELCHIRNARAALVRLITPVEIEKL